MNYTEHKRTEKPSTLLGEHKRKMQYGKYVKERIKTKGKLTFEQYLTNLSND